MLNELRGWLRAMLLAVQFLSQLPVPVRFVPQGRDQGRAVACFPLVGLLIGGLLGLLGMALMERLPVAAAAAALLGCWLLLTGYLHLDGLADSADAWWAAGRDRRKSLEVLQDPHCGVAGATTIGIALLLKYGACWALLDHHQPWLLLWPPLLARAALALVMTTSIYLRPEGLGADMIRHAPVLATWLLSSLALSAAILQPLALGALLAVIAVAAGLRLVLHRWLGGVTGDGLGAMLEILEISALYALVLTLGT